MICEGVPAAIGVARATYAVIVQNFGWAMGYNVAALPLAAFGLFDPLVAAVAMGLSSVIVVLNSLRLRKLGRDGLSAVGSPRFVRGVKGVALSVAVPIVLFACLVVVSQMLSPARGQSLLPTVPSVTSVGPAPRRVGGVISGAGRSRGEPVPSDLRRNPGTVGHR